MSNEVAGKTLTADNISVTNNAITVGIDQSAGWIVADNFKLYYYGPTVAGNAIALPNGGAMEAGQWYYFDVVTAADNYTATATTLGDIIYTTAGSTLIEDESGSTDKFTAENNSLSATRYYVKSSSAQSLAIAPASYSYSISEASANVSYIQAGNTVTVSYTTSTNDPDATLTQNYASVTFGGNAISVTPTASGFTFTVPTVTANTDYTLSIPAGAIKYNDDNQNAAQEITLKTPAIFDGYYYFYNVYNNKYLSRGNTWGTQAILDSYGLPAYIEFDGEGKTKVKFFDNQKYLSDGGWLYADNGTGGTFLVEAVTGGYKFKDASVGKYVAVWDGLVVGDAVEGSNLQGTSNIWALETPAQYKAKDNATTLANEQAATAATASGLLGITTKATLEEELSTNYVETPISINGGKGEAWQKNASGDNTNGGSLKENEYIKETVTNLIPGLYRLSVDAFQRATTNERVAATGGARSLIYVYAGSAKTQLKSVMEYGADVVYTAGNNPNFAYEGKNYPNSEASAYVALETGNYKNDVYVYVAADEVEETGSLTFGINNPQNASNCGIWAVYQNFTLVRFEAKATEAEKTALAQAISDAESKTLGFENGEYAPYNNVAALETLAAAKAVSVNDASGVAVVAATTALTSATWTANESQLNAVYNGTFALTANDGAPAGWVLTGATGSGNSSNVIGGQYRPRAFVLGESAANYAKLASFNQEGATRSAFYVRFDDRTATNAVFTYGETEGYTMPLKAATYRLKAKAGGWGKTLPLQFNIVNSTDETVVVKSVTLEDIDKTGTASDYIMYFQVTTPGTYKLKVTNSSDKDNAAAISNIELYPTSTVEFVDGQAVPAYAPGTYSQVKLTRTLVKNRWYTAVYPFAITVDNVNIDKIATLESYNAETGTLNFSSANASTANVPFLFHAKENNSDFNLATTNVEVSAASATPATADQASLIGTYGEQTLTANEEYKYYVLSNNTIYPVGADGATIPAYRAYIQIAQGSAARSLKFVIDCEETTGIDGIATESVSRGEVYNLNGQRVASPRKGLYIQNGKKVLVK
jgi:hypothetical protein